MNWLEIATRCEKATRPDREIDWSLVEAIGKAGFYLNYAKHPLSYKGLVPAYTASIDAIAALIEREVPKQGWIVNAVPGLRCAAKTDAIEYITATSPALALCAAFARAMHDKENE